MKRFGSSRPTAYPVQCGCGHLMARSRGDGPTVRAACDEVATIAKNSEPIPPRRRRALNS